MLETEPNSLVKAIERKKGPVEISTKILKKLVCLFKEALIDNSVTKQVRVKEKKTQELWLKEERKEFFKTELKKLRDITQ